MNIVAGLILGAVLAVLGTLALDAILIGVEGVFRSIIPGGDPFWSEGIGVALWSIVISIAFTIAKGKHPLKGTDAFWLIINAFSLALTLASVALFSLNPVVTFLFSAFFVALQVYSTIQVWRNRDWADNSQNPLKHLEEVASTIATLYGIASLTQMYNQCRQTGPC